MQFVAFVQFVLLMQNVTLRTFLQNVQLDVTFVASVQLVQFMTFLTVVQFVQFPTSVAF